MSILMLKTKTAGYYMVQNANLLLYSQLFSNAAWTKTNVTLTSGQTDPDAGTEAFTATAGASNATLLQSITLDGSKNRTFTVFLKRKTGVGNISLTVDGSTYVVTAITGAWVRYSTTLLASGTVTCGIKIATSGDEVYVAWADLSDGVPSWATSTQHYTNTANRYTVTQITDPEYPANTARGCVYLDGRFFVMEESTADIYQSGLTDSLTFTAAASWAANEQIGSQIDSDQGVYLGKHNNYIMALKKWSTEFFYDAANSTGSILAPVANATFKIGCASEDSVKEMSGTIIWMGQTRDGFGRGIFQLAAQSPVQFTGLLPSKISTPQVDKILNADSLAAVYSWTANVGSHVLYGLTLVNSAVTLVYDLSSQLWSFFTYLSSAGGAKTITAITATGQATSTAHGFSDGDIINVTATNADFNGWHVASEITTDTFQLQATGTAFSGSGSAQEYAESYFPISSSTASGGKQYMQHATSGALYEFSQSTYTDPIGAIACRIRTPKLDAGTANPKFMAMIELIGDKIASKASVRFTDDDFATYSKCRMADLSIDASRIARHGRFSRRAFEIIHVKPANLRLEAIEVTAG